MKNQTFRMTMLFDFYGELLTDRQKEFYDLYYNEDLSLSEIADEMGVLDKVLKDGWKSLSAKETGRIGGLMTKKKKHK